MMRQLWQGGLLTGILLFSLIKPATAGDPFRGEKIYAMNCQQCHGSKGRSRQPGFVPDLSWRGGSGTGLWQSDPHLLKRIRQGNRSCPSYMGILVDRDILDVITYMRTFL